jgi:hypothetical protein
MVVAISSEADVIAPLSMDRFNQERAIAALDPWSTTALHDANHRRARSARARKRPAGCLSSFQTAPTGTAAQPLHRSSSARAGATR